MHRSLLAWTFALLIAAFASCSKQEESSSFGGTAMGMPYAVTVGKRLSCKERDRLNCIVAETFALVDSSFNNWNPLSEISLFNSSPAGTQLVPSVELTRLLQITDKAVLLTHGLFDPTIEPLRLLWKRRLAEETEPGAEELAAAKSAVGWRSLYKEERLEKSEQGQSLDLCGISKGHAVDLIVERLQAAGYPDLFVDWGGDLRASGRHPSGRLWRVYIARFEDRDPDHAIDTLELNNEAVATSGDYIHNWKAGAASFSHLINPMSGKATELSNERIASATVTAPSCALADALATAALLFETMEEASSWAREVQKKIPEARFWFAARQGEPN